VTAVDDGRGGGAVGAAEAPGAVGEPRDGVGEPDGGLQPARGARRPVPPHRAPPLRPVPGVAPVAELQLVIFSQPSSPHRQQKFHDKDQNAWRNGAPSCTQPVRTFPKRHSRCRGRARVNPKRLPISCCAAPKGTSSGSERETARTATAAAAALLLLLLLRGAAYMASAAHLVPCRACLLVEQGVDRLTRECACAGRGGCEVAGRQRGRRGRGESA
jgi:hypothetical protein